MRLHQLDARGVRHPQIEHNQIEIVEVGAHVREQLRHGFDDHGAMPGRVERGLEPIAHERRIGCDSHGLACRR